LIVIAPLRTEELALPRESSQNRIGDRLCVNPILPATNLLSYLTDAHGGIPFP